MGLKALGTTPYANENGVELLISSNDSGSVAIVVFSVEIIPYVSICMFLDSGRPVQAMSIYITFPHHVAQSTNPVA